MLKLKYFTISREQAQGQWICCVGLCKIDTDPKFSDKINGLIDFWVSPIRINPLFFDKCIKSGRKCAQVYYVKVKL